MSVCDINLFLLLNVTAVLADKHSVSFQAEWPVRSGTSHSISGVAQSHLGRERQFDEVESRPSTPIGDDWRLTATLLPDAD
jgi:hypothetical protein